MAPDDFIAAIATAAQQSAAETKVPASFTIAQAALESGWGSSKSATMGSNLFGIKADKSWKGPTFELPTKEYINGQWITITAKWRKYDDWYGGIKDHAQFFLDNPRYKGAFAYSSDPENFARAVAKAGYATAPNYADSLIAVIRSHNLTQYDVA